MNKPHTAILSLFNRIRLAARVFREGPDAVVTLKEVKGGAVKFTHPFGYGLAGSRTAALKGAMETYQAVYGPQRYDHVLEHVDGPKSEDGDGDE